MSPELPLIAWSMALFDLQEEGTSFPSYRIGFQSRSCSWLST